MFEVAEDLLLIAVFFGKNATTIFLHIEANLARLRLAFAEADAKIAIDKFETGEGGKFFAEFFNYVVFLVRRDEEGSSKTIKAV